MTDDPNQLVLNEYAIYEHPLFLQQMETLAQEIEQESPNGHAGKSAKAKLMSRILTEMDNIAAKPDDAKYRLGKTMGGEYKHWRRAKFMGRYRLFFRYDSIEKIIIFVWVNDENTKRTYGSKTDAYAVFKKMLEQGNPPDKWEDLLKSISDRQLSNRPDKDN